jgi:cobalt-zinc-cadmium efflux system outer membrane protein
MKRALTAQLALALAASLCHPVLADKLVLTLDEALALARDRAPDVRAARGRIDEERGKVVGARVLLRENPEVELVAGRRDSPATGRSIDARVGVEQTFELGGRRGARIRQATSGVERASAQAADVERQAGRDMASAFYRAVHAEELRELAVSSNSIAEALLATAERRHKAGEIADLDLNLAKVAVARAHADRRRADALQKRAIGEIRAQCGIATTTEIEVRGQLAPRKTYDLDSLVSRVSERPDLRALAAEAREAQATIDLGRASAWPEVGLRVEYEREEQADILLGGIIVRFPLFEHGQELRATGRSRKRRVAAQSAALQRAINAEVSAAHQAHADLVAGVEDYETAVAVLDDNETLARRSYDAGEIGVAQYLAVRREILEARRGYLEQKLEAVLAGVELETSAGVQP